MHRLTPLAVVCAIAGCATTATSPRAAIAPELFLSLPTPPGYPSDRTLLQTAKAHYGEQSASFEAIVTLSPELVEVVVTAPSGPRLSTIHWDKAGVKEERALIAPQGLPVENLLADLFVANWPTEVVQASLPPDAAFEESNDGARAIRIGGEIVFEITPHPDEPQRVLVRNRALGYEIDVRSQVLE